MRSDTRRFVRAVVSLVACLVLAGCMTPSAGTRSAGTSAPVRAERQSDSRAEAQADSRADSRADTRSERRAADAPETEVEVAAVEVAVDPIAAILSERRRGDYPEFELLETGFTITEQVRIGNAARTDYERALIYLRQERFDEGIAILQQVIEESPDASVPYIDLGIAYGLAGDLDSAEEALQTAALLSPENPIVHNELGILYRRTGRFTESRDSYERALEVFDDFHFARRNLGVLCDLYIGDVPCALENYRAYLDAVGTDPEVEIWVTDLENRLVN